MRVYVNSASTGENGLIVDSIARDTSTVLNADVTFGGICLQLHDGTVVFISPDEAKAINAEIMRGNDGRMAGINEL